MSFNEVEAIEYNYSKNIYNFLSFYNYIFFDNIMALF